MNDSFTALHDLLSRNPDLADTGTPASTELIEKAERFLGLKFDEPFRKYLSTWGTVSFGPLEFYGLTDSNFENGCIPNAVWFTVTNRKQVGLPHQLIAIFDNDGDEFYCIDNNSGGAVVIWDVITRSVRVKKAPNIIDMIYREASEFLHK